MIGIIVGDVLAAKKIGGFASHGHKWFCNYCRLSRKDLCNNLETSTWLSFSHQKHLRVAKLWRDAKSVSEREGIFAKYGIRYSELLRLPYLQMTKWLAADPMHAILSNVVQYHIRTVFGISGKSTDSFFDDSNDTNHPHVIKPVKQGDIEKGEEILGYIYDTWDKTQRKTRTSKKDNPSNSSNANVVASTIGNITKAPVISQYLLTQIRRDIAATNFAPHLANDAPPHNFGSSRHGTLKAAQWRTACCYSLLITLTRVWSMRTAPKNADIWLKNFHHLVALVRIAYQTTVTSQDVASFRHHCTEYVRGLCQFCPQGLRPSHHYLLHLGDMMERFGPMRGWWAFPYERFNGMIQRLSTNHKLGEDMIFHHRFVQE
ncbi:hypothetical protein CPB86DRAFT_717598 [Serendipita vermifera]|nr:hypothetical protein CPB86DRAFT_717598 [Serendipita vermifera]